MLNVLPPDHDRLEADELVQLAGEATEQPPEPPGGIPKQWLPGFIRWPIRAILTPLVLMDTFAQSVARKIIRPPFKQVGNCYQRGNCCFYVLLPEPKGILGRFFYWWYTQVHGFYARRKTPIEVEGKPMMVMGCRYLQKDGRCGHYRLRPAVCREWPVIEHFGLPKRLKGCGFRAELRK